ncbi:MAG: ABC transporter ATP-binding protein [Conexivisphaerales archaeon]
MGVILEVDELVKKFGGLRALDGLSLKLHDGQITLIIGPNGSGKTTLMNCITGLYKPDRGRVIYNGTDITGMQPHEIAELGLVRTFQIPMPFPKLTVLENLLIAYKDNPGESLFWSIFKGKWLKNEEEALEKAHKILEFLQLSQAKKQLAQELSGGQMKLLEIGRALMADANTLLLDEPAGSVAPTLAHEIFAHIRRLRDELKLNFLIVEHRLDIAADYVDYVYAMSSGKVISEGHPDEVFNDPKVIEVYLGE